MSGVSFGPRSQVAGPQWHKARKCLDGCGAEAGEQCRDDDDKPALLPCADRRFDTYTRAASRRAPSPPKVTTTTCCVCGRELLRVVRPGWSYRCNDSHCISIRARQLLSARKAGAFAGQQPPSTDGQG